MTTFHLHSDGRIENEEEINLDVSSGFAIWEKEPPAQNNFFLNSLWKNFKFYLSHEEFYRLIKKS